MRKAEWTGNMNKSDSEIGILKTLWSRNADGRWGIQGLKGLTLKPQKGFDADFFKFESQIDLMTSTPPRNIHDALASFGSTNFLIKQSILPVVAWVENENYIRCVGTAFLISCTGYVVTACHVLIDPQERGYGKIIQEEGNLRAIDGLQMGVFIPLSPAYGTHGFRFFPFERSWYWGEWKDSPLLHEREKFDFLTDVAICKIAEMPNGAAHQPLSLSLNPFTKGEKAYAYGYASMDDIPIEIVNGKPTIKDFKQDIYVSVGAVIDTYPENHLKREVPTPGPCFDFRARVPGKMSGVSCCRFG